MYVQHREREEGRDTHNRDEIKWVKFAMKEHKRMKGEEPRLLKKGG